MARRRSRVVSSYHLDSLNNVNVIQRTATAVVEKTFSYFTKNNESSRPKPTVVVHKPITRIQGGVTTKPIINSKEVNNGRTYTKTYANPLTPVVESAKIPSVQIDHSKYMPKHNNQQQTTHVTETVSQTNPKPTLEAPKQQEAPKQPKKKYPAVRTSFNYETDTFVVNGTSVRGSSHIVTNDPCQDYSDFKDLGKGWAIAVTADGAGSCKKSHQGSRANCIKAIQFYSEILTNYGWVENNYEPSELDWHMESCKVFDRIFKDSCKYANAKGFNPRELSATIIVNVITPYGLLVAHIGDGRAGYLNSKDEWLPSINPHKGEESNQTVFLHSNMHSVVGFKMSGVYVPECKIIKDDIKAFTLMSDGCEKSTWICSLFENEQFSDPNKPHAPFFNNVINHLKKTDTPNSDLSEILIDGTAAFKKETDDKTIIIGYKKD